MRTLRSRASIGACILLTSTISATAVHAQVSVPLRDLADNAFVTAVDDAIELGRRGLKESLANRDHGEPPNWAKSYPMGYPALMAYALLEAGEPPDSNRIRDLFNTTDSQQPRSVYSVSIYMMALDALSRARLRASGKSSGRKAATGVVAKRMKQLCHWIVDARWPKRGTWGYEHWKREQQREWEDYSNTQFAVLALQVALSNGIRVPDAAFEAVRDGFADNAWTYVAAAHSECVGAGWWAVGQGNARLPVGVVEFDKGKIILEGDALGWGYRPGFGSTGAPGQYSMVCAATSSLMVVRRALVERGKISDNDLSAIDRLIEGGVLSLTRDLDVLVPAKHDTIHRNYYYSLYSLEKAMDLGGIERLGDVDWYRCHALYLIQGQDKSGLWGDSAPGYEYQQVSTAFALLFLRRATHHLIVGEAAPVQTGKGAVADEVTVRAGRVLVPSLRGVLDISDFFRALAHGRTAEQLQLAREIVEVVPPDEIIDLVPYLIPLRNASRDSTDRFAIETLARITGLDGEAPIAALRAFLDEVRELRLVRADERDKWRTWIATKVAERTTTSDVYRIELLRAMARLAELDYVDHCIAELAAGPQTVSETADRALESVFGRSSRATELATPEQRAEAAAAWRSYWQANATRLRFYRAWGQLVTRLSTATTPGERRRAREAIIALGPIALKSVNEQIAADHYLFDWLLIRRALDPSSPGIE